VYEAGRKEDSRRAAAPASAVQTRSRGVHRQHGEAAVATADQRKRKRAPADPPLTIEYRGQAMRRVNVPPPEIPQHLVDWLRKKSIVVPSKQVIHLKKMPGAGLGLFASRRIPQGTLIDMYNGELVDLDAGQTRSNTDSNFGTHHQSLHMLGAVRGNGFEYIRGDLHTGNDGFDYSLEFFVENGTASFMNAFPDRTLHNVDMIAYPPMLRLVSTGAAGG